MVPTHLLKKDLMIVWCAASQRRCWKLISRLTFIILCQSTGWLFAAFSDFSFWHDSLKTSITRCHYLSFLKLPLCRLFSPHCLSFFEHWFFNSLCLIMYIYDFSTFYALLRCNISKVRGENRPKKPPKLSVRARAAQAWMTEGERGKEGRLSGRDHLRNVQIEMGVSCTKTCRQIKVNSFPGRHRKRGERGLRGYLVNGACQLTLCRNPLIPQNFN